SRDRVHVVLHGVDLKKFFPAERRTSLRESLGMTDRTILSAGTLDQNKGHHLTIEALASLPRDTQLYLAGEGPEKKSLYELARSRGVTERVHFLGQIG